MNFNIKHEECLSLEFAKRNLHVSFPDDYPTYGTHDVRVTHAGRMLYSEELFDSSEGAEVFISKCRALGISYGDDDDSFTEGE